MNKNDFVHNYEIVVFCYNKVVNFYTRYNAQLTRGSKSAGASNTILCLIAISFNLHYKMNVFYF